MAIVASLVFVGLQLKQSHEIALASQYHARISDARGLWQAILESGYDFYRIVETPDEDLTSVERSARLALIQMSWLSAQNQHFQYEAGFFTDESWESSKRIIESLLSNPPSRGVFERNKATMPKSFVEVVEQLAADAGE